jgi:hypothetical protein
MGSRADTKRLRVEKILRERRPGIIDESVASELRILLAPISDSYLRELLRGCGIPLTAPVEGVVTSSYDDLERTLLALADEYAASDRDRRTRVRALVIDAKARIRWAQARAVEADQQSAKGEMLLWTLTWLENPDAFRAWVSLRKRQLETARSQPSE